MKLKYLVFAMLFGASACGGGNGGAPTGGDTDQTDTDVTDNGPTDQDGDSGQCTVGALRCGGDDKLAIEECSADGTWGPAPQGHCPYACVNGMCTGTCGPGSTRCSQRDVATQQVGSSNTYLMSCIGGTSCADPVAIFVETCGDDGVFFESAACGACQTNMDGSFVDAACDYCSTGGGLPVATCINTDGCATCR